MAKDVKLKKWPLSKDQGEDRERLISKRPVDLYVLE